VHLFCSLPVACLLVRLVCFLSKDVEFGFRFDEMIFPFDEHAQTAEATPIKLSQEQIYVGH